MGKKRRIRRGFTAEFRTEAVHLMTDRLREGESLVEIGRGIDVEPYLLRRWAKQMGVWPGEVVSVRTHPVDPAADPEVELKRLRKEVEVLRQERDFLKKATAFFAKESQ